MVAAPVFSLTRRETFSACHRLFVPTWSAADNERAFGKCVHRHGHNYVVEVTLRGPADPATGMVMDVHELKRIIQRYVVEAFDHRDIDEDVVEFRERDGDGGGGGGGKGLRSTAENIALVAWNRLAPHLNGLLHKVRLYETEKNVVTYKGAT